MRKKRQYGKLTEWGRYSGIKDHEKEALLACYGMCGGRITDHYHVKEFKFMCMNCRTLREAKDNFNMFDLGLSNSKFYLTGTSKSFGKDKKSKRHERGINP